MSHPQKEFDSNQVNRRFNRDAGVFEAIYNEDEKGLSKWFNKSFRKPVYERYAIALETIGNATGKTVLDVGCGTGIYMVAAAEQGARRVVGIDLSEEMLVFTKKKLHEKNLTDVCKLILGNFLELDIKEKYHYSLAMGVFDYLPDPITFMHKLKLVTTDKVIASFPGHSLIRKPLRQLRYLLTVRGTVHFYSKKDVQYIAESVGFARYDIVPIKTGSGFILIASP